MRARAIAIGSLVVAVGIVVAGLSLATPDRAVMAAARVAPAPDTQLAFDESTAVVIAQDEFTTTRTDANGISQDEISFTPQRVLVEAEWLPVSSELSANDRGRLEATLHPLKPEFADVSSDGDLVSFSHNGYEVGLSLAGVDAADASQVGESQTLGTDGGVEYADAIDGADVVFGLADGIVREAIVLDAPPTGSDLTYTWKYDVPGLSAERDEFGDLIFVDDVGETQFTMTIPGMWDSSGELGDADGAAVNIDYDFERVSDTAFTVTLHPDVTWLTDPARVYPVSIDPTTSVGASSFHGYKQDGYAANDSIRIGNTSPGSSCCLWRTVLKYSLTSYSGKRVIGAQVYGQWYYGEDDARAGSLHHASRFSYSGVGSKLSNFTISGSGWAKDSALPNWVSDQVNKSSWTGYLMIRGNENRSVYSYKKIHSAMYVTYIDRPSVAGLEGGAYGVTPLDGDHVYADDVQIEGKGTVGSGATAYFQYKFTSANGGVSYTSPWLAKGPHRVPETALTPGADYTYEILLKDNYAATPYIAHRTTSRYTFHVIEAPQAPSGVVLTDESGGGDVSATLSADQGVDVWAIFTISKDGIVLIDGLPGSIVAGDSGGGVSTVELPYALAQGDDYTVTAVAFDGHLAGDPTTSGPFPFAGTQRDLREIPGNQDTQTGAV
jgi:hypothetical protein